MIIFLLPALVFMVLGNKLSKHEEYTAELLSKVYLILSFINTGLLLRHHILLGFIMILIAIPSGIFIVEDKHSQEIITLTKLYIGLTGVAQLCYWLGLFILA